MLAAATHETTTAVSLRIVTSGDSLRHRVASVNGDFHRRAIVIGAESVNSTRLPDGRLRRGPLTTTSRPVSCGGAPLGRAAIASIARSITALPAAVCGRIEPGTDADWYRVRLQAGDGLTLACRSATLGGTLQPTLVVLERQEHNAMDGGREVLANAILRFAAAKE